MSHPKENSKLQYENDTMSINFNPTVKGIEMEIFNKTNEGMKMEWDEISISVSGKTYRVLHGVMYIPYYLSNKFISAYYNIEIVDIVKKK